MVSVIPLPGGHQNIASFGFYYNKKLPRFIPVNNPKQYI
jgi:hypothetical protein